MRLRFLLALLLAACSPASPPAQEAAPSAPASAPATSAPPPQLAGAVAEGRWVFEASAEGASAGFGLPDSEIQFNVHCARATRVVTLGYEHELSPDQDTTLTLHTAAGAVDFPARSFNEGLPNVSAEITVPADGDARLAALARVTDRFAVDVGGATLLLPMEPNIRRVLALCGITP